MTGFALSSLVHQTGTRVIPMVRRYLQMSRLVSRPCAMGRWFDSTHLFLDCSLKNCESLDGWVFQHESQPGRLQTSLIWGLRLAAQLEAINQVVFLRS